MNLKLEVQRREPGKKSDTKSLRRKGLIPAIVYGEGKVGIPVSVPMRDFMQVFRRSFGHVALFDVSLDDKVFRTIIKEKQIHPVTREVLHIDFQELHAGKEISVEIPLTIEGEAPGTSAGGLVDVSMRTLLCYSLPKNIKKDITVDISKLEVGDTIHVRDLDLGAMNTRVALELPVASVQMSRVGLAEEEAAEAEAAEAAEAAEGEEGAEAAAESTEE
ncbi:MAG: 50S ribosomal protein L25 [Candidatus Cloacimonetes bacterium]|nr:50S ribosomal protein L25 [Candidatus Cloacimonadota bacterium]